MIPIVDSLNLRERGDYPAVQELYEIFLVSSQAAMSRFSSSQSC